MTFPEWFLLSTIVVMLGYCGDKLRHIHGVLLRIEEKSK
jgi:hypothetical protein